MCQCALSNFPPLGIQAAPGVSWISDQWKWLTISAWAVLNHLFGLSCYHQFIQKMCCLQSLRVYVPPVSSVHEATKRNSDDFLPLGATKMPHARPATLRRTEMWAVRHLDCLRHSDAVRCRFRQTLWKQTLCDRLINLPFVRTLERCMIMIPVMACLLASFLKVKIAPPV